jgi:hypothetical protein
MESKYQKTRKMGLRFDFTIRPVRRDFPQNKTGGSTLNFILGYRKGRPECPNLCAAGSWDNRKTQLIGLRIMRFVESRSFNFLSRSEHNQNHARRVWVGLLRVRLGVRKKTFCSILIFC